jgi:dihydroorotate dehydrogenase
VIYPLLRAALFTLGAETAHDLSLAALRRFNRGALGDWLKNRVAELPVEIMGIRFPNPVGLSAGLDKNGDCIHGLANLGFGFVEIGTVTPRAQPGNPKPRIFRLPERRAIINRMGFNNAGVDQLVKNVRAAKFDGVLGINIGKNLDTPLEKASDDYLQCMDAVYPYASYITVNVSSPNTPGLRTLQRGDALEELFGALKARQKTLSGTHQKYVPLAVKIAPDLRAVEVDDIAAAVRRHAIDAVVATNTSNSRDGVEGLKFAGEGGGLSGEPLFELSTEVVRQLAKSLGGHTPIIAVGGIMQGADALVKINAGAEMVQLYSGLIYRGPGLIGDCVNALLSIRARNC